MPAIDEYLLTQYQQAIVDEFVRATKIHGGFHSDHEAYAVLKEEMDELWEAVRMKPLDPRRSPQIEKECIQVAAMALRMVHDMRLRE